MTRRFHGTGGWFGVLFGVGSVVGTAIGHSISDPGMGHGEEVTTIIALVIATFGFVHVFRSGTADLRTGFVVLVSVASIHTVVTVLDVTIGRRSPGGGTVRSVVAIEGTLLETARPGRRDSVRGAASVVKLRIDSNPAGIGCETSLTAGEEIEVRIVSGSIIDSPGVRVSVVGTMSSPGRLIGNMSDRSRHSRGSVSILVPDARLIRSIVDPNRSIHVDWVVAIHAEMRARLRRGIDAMVSCDDDGSPGGSFLPCLLTGDRDRLEDRTRSAFKRSGVSHLLAISGLHLAVVASVPWILLGWFGVGRCIRVSITTMFVIGGVILVESSPSVIRAVAMIVPVLTGTAIGAVFGVIPLLGVVAGCMLWTDPGWIESPGFQLSFVATAALAFSCHEARTRWFGPRDSIGRSRWEILRDRWATLATASIVACLATLPIVESRFGMVSPCVIPASIVIAPLMFAFLALIVPVAIIAMVDPDLGRAFARPITGFELFLRELVIGVADVSPVILTLDPGITWTIIATILGVTAPGLVRHAVARRVAGAILLVLITVPMLPSVGPSISGRMRVDMLAVGDGTAILVRTPRSSVLFDAGSSSIPGHGSERIFRALRSLGVRHLDGILVSHANIDHHGAIPALVRMIPTKSIVVTPAFLRRVHRSTDMPGAETFLESIEHVRTLRVVSRSDRIDLPDGEWSILHPDIGDRFRRINDESMSIRVDGPSSNPRGERRIADLVLFGDLETVGVTRLMDRTSTMRARVMELPHHGSWRPVVVDLIEAVSPELILQSTGPRRLETDRFGPVVRGRVRLVTCRDGDVAVTIARDDSMTIKTTGSEFLSRISPPWAR